MTIFPYTECIVEFCDIVRFKIELVVEEKFMCKNVTKQTQHSDCHSSSNVIFDDLDLTAVHSSVNILGLC